MGKLLLVFIPVTLALEHLLPERPALVFLSAVLAIVPLAGLIVQATDRSPTVSAMPPAGCSILAFSRGELTILS